MTEVAMSEFAIATKGLTRRFGRMLAVDHIDLRVPIGSVYGYLGRNGAGKTTTIQMLMGLIEPTAGEMSVMDFDPLRQEVPMKRVVSYVPERVHLYDWMRIREVLWFGANIHPHWDAAFGEQLAARLDLPLDRKIGQLSRGMQGKVALVVALASHPKLLILDDPTSGLDAIVRREFMESIVGVLQESGTTVFFSSHIIDDVERVADWIGILDGGKLIVQSPLDDLKASVRRITATFPDGAAEVALDGVLSQEGEGRQRAFVCRDCNDAKLEALRRAGATGLQVEDCSLEDIFVAHVRKQPVEA
jgi:ABC-2 type transport system ATP-binding protein